ncbi:hypothetical protein GUY61_12540 [Streptomyces sp. GC420]|nr:hypothetical protein [Streptomyces sp. GC420]
MTGASAVALYLLLAGCGSGGSGRDGYAAVGAGPGAGTPESVRPTGEVELIPLDGDGTADAAPRHGNGDGTAGAVGGSDSGPGGTPGGETDGRGSTVPGGGTDGTDPGQAAHEGGPSSPGDRTPSPGPSQRPGGTETGPGSSPAPAPGPAVLTVGAPVLADAAQRWCEKVTVEFRNTGGSPATSGTVTFGTHIIGALGVDWATIPQTRDLPAPIAAGSRTERTWTLCVESWRVPLGMHVDTLDVTAVLD